MADLPKNTPLTYGYHAEFDRSVLNDVGINAGEPKIESTGIPLFWDLRGGRPQDTHPSQWYHIRFGSSATKGVHINRKEPQNWGALGSCPLWADHLKTIIIHCPKTKSTRVSTIYIQCIYYTLAASVLAAGAALFEILPRAALCRTAVGFTTGLRSIASLFSRLLGGFIRLDVCKHTQTD